MKNHFWKLFIIDLFVNIVFKNRLWMKLTLKLS